MGAESPPPVRGCEEIRDGTALLVLENGEATLALDPEHGGRWTTWDLALAGGPVHRLMSAPGTAIQAGRGGLAGAASRPGAGVAVGAGRSLPAADGEPAGLRPGHGARVGYLRRGAVR